jgi:hypothetical protein
MKTTKPNFEILAKIVEVFDEKVTPDISPPAFNFVKRGFVEFIIDLGASEIPNQTLASAIDALYAGDCISGFVFLTKRNTAGMYCYGIASVEQYVSLLKYNFEFENNLNVVAVAFENFPDYAKNVDGTRRHLFSGIGDPEEVI